MASSISKCASISRVTRSVAVRPYASPAVRRSIKPVRVIDIDVTDPDTQLALAGLVLVSDEWLPLFQKVQGIDM